MIRHASRHSMTRWLKSDVAALLARIKLLAITKKAFDGNLIGVALNGFHSMNWAHPSAARKAIAWSMPPPMVPMYRSQSAEIFDNSSLFNDNCLKNHRFKSTSIDYPIRKPTSLMKLVASVAALTNALELDRPEAGGMLPFTSTRKPRFCAFVGSRSTTPRTPQRK